MKIQINNLKKTFGPKVAVNIDEFHIQDGEILGLVGNNGAGKSTLFRLMLDLIKADTGRVRMQCGDADVDVSETEEWKDWTGAYIDEGFLIDYLTPDEYFQFIANISNMSEKDCEDKLATFETFLAGELLGQKKLIRNLSAGNKQKVGIVAAMLLQPQLLILDEPFNFLDPTSQLSMKYLLESYSKEHKATIIVSSHNLTHTLDICSRITLLEQGHIIKDYDRDYALLTSEIEAYFRGGMNI